MAGYDTRFAILLFTDIVGSTHLKTTHGLPAFREALRTHNEHFERIARECRGIRILQNMGDGYFAETDSVAEAVKLALLFQNAMRDEPWGNVPITARVGIHAGEISAIPAEGGSGIVAPAADLAARVMSLASGGQILLTRFPFDEARHFLREHPAIAGKTMPPLCWLAHGPYLLKGRDEPMDIFEVGAEGLAPLTAPADGEKAKRAIRPGEEETLGWRPAAGLEIPGRAGWNLTERLGVGGFGEVWIGEHGKFHQRRAFKFCFDDERLRALKREVTLVRLLRSALGERDDIVRFYELKLDEPPFYLESDLAPQGNLLQWAERQGGLGKIPLAQRIALVAHTATALAAAHSIGVLHKDIKPTNILIFDAPDGTARPRLVDFGIGTLADPEILAQQGITGAGFTRMTIQHSTGTPTYSPPEYLAGRPYTIQGDIYGLGVLLYQLVTARPLDPLAPGWERDIPDPLLREDIATCVDGDPARRFPSAADLAERLLKLDERRAAALRENQRVAALERRAYRRGLWRAAAMASGVVAIVSALAVLAFQQAAAARASRARADSALADLRKTAPTFQSAAKSLLDAGKFDEAIEKIGYAIELDGTHPGYRLFRANLLEAMQKLAEAAAEYRRVLALHPDNEAARTNLALSERLLAENGGAPALRKELQKQLLDALRTQGRLVEAGPLNALFEPDIAIAEATLRARLHEYRNQAGWKEGRVARVPDGTFSVDLSFLTIGDLSLLKGLPISVLNLQQNWFDKNGLADLSKIVGLPLKVLDIYDSKVKDLSPLRGMPLEDLDISRTKVTDLTPLAGMKLRRLVATYGQLSDGLIYDLKPLAGMPLEHLSLENANNVVDISPLRGAPLTYLNLNRTRVSDLSPLIGMPLQNLQVGETNISDLSALASCHNLVILNLYADKKVKDLTPLAGLKLTHLQCDWNGVTNLDSLRGQPLKYIKIDGFSITDVSPLVDCPTLEEIMLPTKVKNVEVLRQMPRLRIITDTAHARTAEEFWKQYDAQQAAGVK